MKAFALSALLALAAPAVHACQTALVLTIDVSNSIDSAEYRLQTDGLADALLDREITEILIRDQVALAVVQWSGTDKQQITLPWTRMRGIGDVLAFSNASRQQERAFLLSNTAPAEALAFSIRMFPDVADCARKVIDVSGDGSANAGGDIGPVRNLAQQLGISINGIAIEGMGVALTNYYRRHVITSDGFVITARGHRDYPRAIREKILREISRVIG